MIMNRPTLARMLAKKQPQDERAMIDTPSSANAHSRSGCLLKVFSLQR